MASKKAAPGKSTANRDLEKAIERDPQSPDAYLVYGDWLIEQGDPLGELVAVQAALEKKPKDKALQKKQAKLIEANATSWLGDLEAITTQPNVYVPPGKPKELEVAWQYGFFRAVTLGGVDAGWTDPARAYPELRRLRTAAFLRSLEFRVMGGDGGAPGYGNSINALIAHGVPTTLRRLAFDAHDAQISWVHLGDLSKLYPLLRRLEELHIKVGTMELGKAVDLPNLRRLEIVTGGLTRANLKSITSAKWSKLEALVLYFGSSSYGGNCRATDLKSIFEAKGLAKLRHLGLCNAEFSDAIAKAIPAAKITKQLKTLDLSKGTLSDVGARALIRGAKSLAGLEQLDVSNNYVTELQDDLKSTFGKRLVLGPQREYSEDYEDERYVQIAE